MSFKGYPVGAARGLLWNIVPSGTYLGMCSGQQASLTHGVASGVYVLDSIHDAPTNPTAPTPVNIDGGDKKLGSVTFGGGGLDPMEVTAPALDSTLANLAGNTTTNTSNSYVNIEGYNLNLTNPVVMGFALQQRFRLESGLDQWLTRFYPRCEVIYTPSGGVFRTVSLSKLRITPIKTNRAHDGRVFGSAGLNLGLEGDLTDFYDYETANPVHIMAYKQDNSTTTFNTIYKPLSTVVTNNATPNAFSIGGTPTALSSITLAGVVTLAAAGSDLIPDVLTYESNYVPI